MTSVYLLLDMQNELVNLDGPAGKGPMAELLRTRQTVDKAAHALHKAREAGIAVGFVRVGFSPDYRECPPASPIFSGARKNGIFQLGTWGTQTHPELDQRPQDIDIVKHRVSPFYATSLEAVLRAQGAQRIYCSGISTNAVVQATVREGHDRDYEIVVLEDACCALSAEEHEGAIRGLQRFCRLTNSRDVVFE